ncbi:MAG TPA: GNAT family N-acetyltransferase [Povalibacter sp.]|uniref:GNAT family N-acetyltransferase n=1 Tax=Povalibacter sp. TaxID=1962978 RepID=UPI002B7A6878|nr:GNAT family N-acetyltransferase [Povalibacter sp.]HMN45394.1 GNAT family N-acetyltransferase [Povalibacter sp.]
MIRPYRESDVEAVALLFTDSVHRLAGSHYDASQRAAWAPCPPDLNSWTRRLAHLKTLVAEVDGKIAGFISYEQNGHIDLLYTSSVYSRRGIASALCGEVEEKLLRDGTSALSTEASLVARPFFEHRGFQVTEEQCVQVHGVAFRRYAMKKPLIAPPMLAGSTFSPTRA